MGRLVKSYWGVFGAFNVIYADPAYYGFFLITGLGISRTLIWLILERGKIDPELYGLMLLVATNLVAVALWTSRLLGSQGRLMFPSISAAALVFAFAMSVWPRPVRWLLALGIIGFLAAQAIYAAGWLIPAPYC